MFSLFLSEEKKMRKHAANWLELADKIYHYRRDILETPVLADLQAKAAALRDALKKRVDAARLKVAIEALEPVLKRAGGTHYPKSGLVENVEFFLVAAIVILGIRTYIVQPFKIPTNSMWPSYYGMTGQVYASPADEPGPVGKFANLVLTGSRPRRIDAPASGEVLVPLAMNGQPESRAVSGRNWLVFPAQNREYALLVGGERLTPATVTVPGDFDFSQVIRDAFFPDDHRLLREILNDPAQAGKVVKLSNGQLALRTGKTVRAGQRLLSFDILTGDQLFVDRVSYHFVRPGVGDGFVFRTDHLAELHSYQAPGTPTDQYYIKRLVGLPGDKLEIRDHTLYRNGAPITGSPAFDKNARQAEDYPGYRNEKYFGVGQTFTVEPDRYMAMGDNSANSLDGRYWGTVPAKDIVGRPLMIYYPFTKRWGPAP
ncbi:signal peptidase [Opitutaceae bacterium TAV5]|nr:signal peptidase [Opitutaceae bacterium TAV5]